VTEDAADFPEEPSEDGVPGPVAERVSACVEYVARAVGMPLDFSADTLPVLDHYVSLVRESARERDALRPLVAQAVGAYFGEVVRRKLGGFWRLLSPNPDDWQLCSSAVFLSFNPIAMAYDALLQNDEHSGPSSRLRLAPDEREVVARRLAQAPEVDEEEFYLLSTRLEGIEIAIEALRAHLEATGYSEVEFVPSDYDAELRPL
jgi:hypothetical protein